MLAIVICDMQDCTNRSKRKMKNYETVDGKPCYGCTLKFISVHKVFDMDGDIEAVSGKSNTAICRHYKYK